MCGEKREKMKGGMKLKMKLMVAVVVGLVVAMDDISCLRLTAVDGATPCGNSTPDSDSVTFKLAPCIIAARNARAIVPGNCCRQVAQLGKRPACLCAAFLSRTARFASIHPTVALTIPKRCNIARPVGYKCGRYKLP